MAEYIEREALIDWLKRIPLRDLSDGRGLCRVIMEDDFKKAIKKMPKGIIADVAPVVHGRWIHPKGYVVSNAFLCSECGHEEASHLVINRRPGGYYMADDSGNFFYHPKINYCPNCGARMDKEDSQCDT